MQPSIGRIVHYNSRGSADGVFQPEPRAAIITGLHPVNEDGHVCVSLAVLNPTGLFFDQWVRYSEANESGTWSWPPRV